VNRGRLFDAVADTYDDVRPDYPDVLYDEIDRVHPVGGARVLDLAAGTGVATRQLRRRGAAVTAVDPGGAMLRQLRHRSPDVPVVVAPAERLPFRPATFDLICCATAWHWLDTRATLDQLAVVAAPGAHLALWWANHRRDDAIPWEAAQGRVHDRWSLKSGSRPPTLAGAGPRDAAADLRRRGLDVVVDIEMTWSRTVDRATHLQVLSTHSDVLDLGERRHGLLAEIEQALAPWPHVEERLWGPLVIARVP
jgi:SAM-dependent methyltransferase